MGNWQQALAGGVIATGVTSALASASRRLGWFQLSFPKVLATAVPGGSRSGAIGPALHAVNGTGFALAYLAPLRRVAPKWRAPAGAALGGLHALVAIGVVAALPSVHPHPRRAGLRAFGPTSYGPLTLPAMLGGHVLYGALVGRALRDAR